MIKVYKFNNEILKNKFFVKNKEESYVFFIHCTKDYYEYFFTTIFSILKNTNKNIEIISFFADYDKDKFFYFKNKIKDFDERIDFHIFEIQKNVLSEK